jgi:hypothetical protein
MLWNNLPLELLARLDPVQVKQYAKATGWVRESRLSDPRIAVYAHPTSDLDQIIVPLNRGARDYARVMGDVVNINGWRRRWTRTNWPHCLTHHPGNRS